MPSCTNPLQINHLIKVTPPPSPPPTCPTHTVSPCKYGEISSHSTEAACGSWKTHLPLLACGNACVLPGRADRSPTNVGEAAAGVGGGGDIDEDVEKIVRTRQRLVVGVCGPSQCKQTVQRAWLPIIFSLWRFDTWGEGGQAHNGAENTASISFLCRSLHLHCSVSPSFAASPFLTQCPHLNSPAASFT